MNAPAPQEKPGEEDTHSADKTSNEAQSSERGGTHPEEEINVMEVNAKRKKIGLQAIKQAGGMFGIDIRGIKQTCSGARNLIYRVDTDEGDLCLREVPLHTKLHGANFINTFLLELADEGVKGIPIPRKIKKGPGKELTDKHGNPVDSVAVIGEEKFSLYLWLEGEHLNEGMQANPQLKAQRIESAARYLANLHNASTSILRRRAASGEDEYKSTRSTWNDAVTEYTPIEGGLEALTSNDEIAMLCRKHGNNPKLAKQKSRHPGVVRSFLEFEKEAQSDDSEVGRFVTSNKDYLRGRIKGVRNRLYARGFRAEYDEQNHLRTDSYVFPLPKTIVHGDYTPQNVLFEGRSVSGVLDFDLACTQERVSDIAWGIGTFCRNPDNSIDLEKAKLFMKSYRESTDTPIEDLECDLIPDQIAMRCIRTSYWPVAEFYQGKRPLSEVRESFDMAKANMELLHWLDEQGKELGEAVKSPEKK